MVEKLDGQRHVVAASDGHFVGSDSHFCFSFSSFTFTLGHPFLFTLPSGPSLSASGR